MSIATTLGSATGNTAAYAKHTVLASGLHSSNFVDAYLDATRTQYAAKDAELAARRAELRAAREAVAEIAVPVRRRQTPLARA